VLGLHHTSSVRNSQDSGSTRLRRDWRSGALRQQSVHRPAEIQYRPSAKRFLDNGEPEGGLCHLCRLRWESIVENLINNIHIAAMMNDGGRVRPYLGILDRR
jgi:hypothetical protein